MRKLFALAVLCTFVCSACTQQSRARKFGGTATIDLPPGMKLKAHPLNGGKFWCVGIPERILEEVYGKA